jgi:hypothetical protein
MQISIYHMTIKWACMNRVVHLIQNTCIKVIVTWSLILIKKYAGQALCILQYIFKLENVSMRIKDQVTMTLIHVFCIKWTTLFMQAHLIFKWSVINLFSSFFFKYIFQMCLRTLTVTFQNFSSIDKKVAH